MATAASGAVIYGSSKAFGSVEVLCSYNEFSQESAGGVVSDPASGKDFRKDFHKSRMTVNNQLEESGCRDTLSVVEKCMKRHTDDIMRVLEGISSRLSHLELYCYNVDKSVGEMRMDLGRDYEETELKLKSLEKHLGDVSRSVHILRDKQELAETQKEIAKLQRAQLELSAPNAHNVEQRSTSPTSDHHKTDETFEVQNQHLAIVLHQVAPQQQSSPTRPVDIPQRITPSQFAPQQQSPPTRPVDIPQRIAPSQFAPPQQSSPTRPMDIPQRITPSQFTPQQHTTQHQHIYVTQSPYQVQAQASHAQYLTSDTQYQNPQPLQQDFNLVRLQPVSQSPPPVHQFIQTRPQPQQPQYMMSANQSIQQPLQSRPQSASGYPSNPPSQSMLQPQEPMHASFSSMAHHMVMTRVDAMPNGYCGKPVQHQQQPPPQIKPNLVDAMPNGYCGKPVQHQQQPPPQIKPNLGSLFGDIYTSLGPRQSLTPASAYMMYGNEQARRQQPPQSQFLQNTYPPTTAPLQHPQQVSTVHNPPQPQSTHTHNDLINKLVNMGFKPDHVIPAIQRMEENRQPINFNALLNILNVQSSATHRPWTG